MKRNRLPVVLCSIAILLLALALVPLVTLHAGASHAGASQAKALVRNAGNVSNALTSNAALTGSLSVSGNTLMANGSPIVLHGVNRSGTEYSCVQNNGIFDGPSDAASVQAIKSWGATLVRVPLNEDCWLGINGMPAAYSGQNYINAIVNFVNLLQANGMYAELSLIWAAPSTYQATYQSGAPDEDHSPAFWSSLASTFAANHNVILAPWGETIVDANCFLNGGVCEATYGPNNTPYNTAGMQQAVNLMRAAGYNGVIAIPGINYANDLTQWLSHEPSDPAKQLIAEAHVYGNNTCGAQNNGACLQSQMAPVAAAVPLLFGETGETYDGSECTSNNQQIIFNWADSHAVSWAAWTWDTWGACNTLALISNYNGTVNAGTYPAYVHTHMLGYAGTGGTPTPTPPTPTTPPSATATPTNPPTATATPTNPPTPPPTTTPTPPPTFTSAPDVPVTVAFSGGVGSNVTLKIIVKDNAGHVLTTQTKAENPMPNTWVVVTRTFACTAPAGSILTVEAQVVDAVTGTVYYDNPSVETITVP